MVVYNHRLQSAPNKLYSDKNCLQKQSQNEYNIGIEIASVERSNRIVTGD